LGIAFVAGRKRVPRPATGNTALRTGLLYCVAGMISSFLIQLSLQHCSEALAQLRVGLRIAMRYGAEIKPFQQIDK
jgi:hypothetical protein